MPKVVARATSLHQRWEWWERWELWKQWEVVGMVGAVGAVGIVEAVGYKLAPAGGGVQATSLHQRGERGNEGTSYKLAPEEKLR